MWVAHIHPFNRSLFSLMGKRFGQALHLSCFAPWPSTYASCEKNQITEIKVVDNGVNGDQYNSNVPSVPTESQTMSNKSYIKATLIRKSYNMADLDISCYQGIISCE